MAASNRTLAPERRVVTPASLKINRRAAGDGAGAGAATVPQICGHAAVFNTWTTLYKGRSYEWRERVNPGAFAHAIAEGQDVRALFNHEPDWLLGRTKSKTCRLSEDNVGLAFECDPPPSQLIADLVLTPMDRGDLDQCSFAFCVRPGGERITIREENDVLIEERELLDLDLYDVSVVTYPAYVDAMCELCSQGARREADVRERRAKSQAEHRSRRMGMAVRLMP